MENGQFWSLNWILQTLQSQIFRLVCVCCCFWAGPRNMRWWPEWRALLTQPHYCWKSTAGDNLKSCQDTPLTPLIWFHILVENLCRIGLNKDRLLGDNSSSKLKGICGNWATMCISWNLAGDTLSNSLHSSFRSKHSGHCVHHSSPTIWELPSTQEVSVFYQLEFFSLSARLAGQRALIGTGQSLVTGPFAQRGVVQSLARPEN